MGRQHTTWISEENWQKLENIPGKSASARIGYAIKHVDPDYQMWVNAKLRQLETAKRALQKLAHRVHELQVNGHANVMPELNHMASLIGEVEWLWEASA